VPVAVLPTAKSLSAFSLKPQSDRLLGRSFGSLALSIVLAAAFCQDTAGRVDEPKLKVLVPQSTAAYSAWLILSSS